MQRAALTLVLALIAGASPARSAETCRAEYERGFAEGVAAVNAQLGAVTARMQRDVQAQVNAQLAELDARRTQELETRLAEAQERAMQGRPPATTAAPGAMPRLPPLVRASGGGIAPALPRDQAAATRLARRPDPRIPADPAALPAGTTITITDPQNLPPALFKALMDYAAR